MRRSRSAASGCVAEGCPRARAGGRRAVRINSGKRKWSRIGFMDLLRIRLRVGEKSAALERHSYAWLNVSLLVRQLLRPGRFALSLFLAFERKRGSLNA